MDIISILLIVGGLFVFETITSVASASIFPTGFHRLSHLPSSATFSGNQKIIIKKRQDYKTNLASGLN